MRRYLAAAMSMLALVLFTGLAYAAEGKETKAAEPKNPCIEKKNCGLEEISRVDGTLKSMDRKEGRMVVTDKEGKDITFKIKGIRAKGIKAGDKVQVTCVKKGEDCYAKKMKKVE